MIICINSLHYTQNKTYKVVVIDEIETLLNKWFNNTTLESNKMINWDRFLDIIKNADKDLGFIQATKDIEISGGGGSPSLGIFGGFGDVGVWGNPQQRWRNSSQIDCSGTLTKVGNSTNVRLIFQKKTLDNFGVPMGISLIEDPEYYQNVFVKIDKSLFLERENLVGR